jgi:DDE family transposase
MKTLVNLTRPDGSHPPRTDNVEQHYLEMREPLASEEGKQHHSQLMVMIEPVFAHIKYNRRVDRFQQRGLAACRAEWKLITATHNLVKLCPTRTVTNAGITGQGAESAAHPR